MSKSTALIRFTKQEIRRMAEPFRSEFKANCGIARVIKTVEYGKCLYEIRYRRNGYNITESNADLKTAKELFIKAF